MWPERSLTYGRSCWASIDKLCIHVLCSHDKVNLLLQISESESEGIVWLITDHHLSTSNSYKCDAV